MSRTRESTTIISPVETFIFFNGNTGKFGMPIEGDSQGIEDIKLPLSFVVLDDGAFRIGGETRGGGAKRKIGSNLAHRDFSTRVTVTYKDNGALIADGEWSQIGQSVKDIGGKYTLVLFVLTKVSGEYKMAAIHLRGRALAEWFKFSKGKNLFGNTAFTIKEVVKTEGEEIDSHLPVFSQTTVSEETAKEADAADSVLQSWLSASFENAFNIEASRPAINRIDSDQKPQAEQSAPFPAIDTTDHEIGELPGDDLPF